MTQRRITTADLASIFASMCDAAQKAGVSESANWKLETGSQTYGRAYRIWLEKEGLTGHYSPSVTDFLGMTAAEAHHTLQAYRSAFLAVVWAKDDSK